MTDISDAVFGKPNETEISAEQAREILTSPGYDAYGADRLYGIIGEGESAGQRIAIKSVQNLERFAYSEIIRINRSQG